MNSDALLNGAAGDFRYFLSDLYRYYFGARLSYAEMLKREDIPPRFKALARTYFLKNVDAGTTLESHLYHLRESDPAYEIFEGLQASVRLTRPRAHRTIFGREEVLFREEIVPVTELVRITPEEKERQGIQICELQFTRRRLREFTL